MQQAEVFQKYSNNEKVNKLIAIPFDKGIGICVMFIENYSSKLNLMILFSYHSLRRFN